MIERVGRRPGGWRGLAPFGLLALLAIASVLPALPGRVELANPDRSAANQFRSAMGALPRNPMVLVALDADLGTYPEIRSATRAALDALLRAGASLALVSFSPEGRAIAAAEVERLRSAGNGDDRVLVLGYRAGAEAGLVLGVTSILPAHASGAVAQRVRAAGGGIDAFDMALLVGGADMNPRSWIEQVATRLPKLPLVAIAPTFLRPELQPYLASGQLAALLGTLRDDAAYVADQAAAAQVPAQPGPGALPMLLGSLVAIGLLFEAGGGRLAQLVGRVAGLGSEDES